MGWAILGLIAVLVVYLLMTYNRLVAMRQRVNQALQVLEAAGHLKVEYGGLRILDLEGLRRFGS